MWRRRGRPAPASPDAHRTQVRTYHCDSVEPMSEKNGDKSRFQINRKRAVARRAAQRQAAPADQSTPKRPIKAKTTPPKSV